MLVIDSRWQNLLIYGFLFVTIVLFPRGIHLPRRRIRARRGQRRRKADGAWNISCRSRVLIAIYVILAPSYNLVIGYGGLVHRRASDLLRARRLHGGIAGDPRRPAAPL